MAWASKGDPAADVAAAMMLSARFLSTSGADRRPHARQHRARPGARPARRAVRLSAGRGSGRRRRGPSSRCRSPAAQLIGVVWDEPAGRVAARAPAEAAGRRSRCAADAAGDAGADPACRARDAGAAGVGAQAGAQRARPRSSRGRPSSPTAGPPRPPPAAAEPAARAPCSRRCPATPRCWPRRWPRRQGRGRGGQGDGRDGLLETVATGRSPVLAAARSRTGRGVELTPAQRVRGRALCRLVAAGSGVALLDGVPGRRQDRGLFRGGGRGAARAAGGCWCCCRRSRSRPSGWPASSAASATAPAVWHSGLDAGPAPQDLAADRRGGDRRRGRRPLGPVPAADAISA